MVYLPNIHHSLFSCGLIGSPIRTLQFFIEGYISFVWRGTNQNDRINSNLNNIFRNDAAHAKVVKDYLIWIIVIEVSVGIGEQTEKSIRHWKKQWHNDVTMTSSLNQPFHDDSFKFNLNFMQYSFKVILPKVFDKVHLTCIL